MEDVDQKLVQSTKLQYKRQKKSLFQFKKDRDRLRTELGNSLKETQEQQMWHPQPASMAGLEIARLKKSENMAGNQDAQMHKLGELKNFFQN